MRPTVPCEFRPDASDIPAGSRIKAVCTAPAARMRLVEFAGDPGVVVAWCPKCQAAARRDGYRFLPL